MWRAIASTRASRSSSGTTSLTRPTSKAFFASMTSGGEQVVGGATPVHEDPRLDRALSRRHAEALQRRIREVGVVGGDDDVGDQPVVGAATDAVTVNLRDRRLGELPQVQDRLDEQVGLRFPRRASGFEALDELRIVHRVVADGVSRAEALAVGPQDQHLDVVVTVGVQQRSVDLLDLLLVLGIRLLGPVQRDLRNGALFSRR